MTPAKTPWPYVTELVAQERDLRWPSFDEEDAWRRDLFVDRAVPGEPGLEIYRDHTKDRYRSADWSQLHCPDAQGVNDLGRCSTRDL